MGGSLFLMEQPSFLEGMARVFDLGDTLTGYNYSRNGDEADHAALWADWELIAGDMRAAARREVERLGRVETK